MRLVLRLLSKQNYSSVESREMRVRCSTVSEIRSTRCSRMYFLKGRWFLRLRTVTSVQETRRSVSPKIFFFNLTTIHPFSITIAPALRVVGREAEPIPAAGDVQDSNTLKSNLGSPLCETAVRDDRVLNGVSL